MLIAALTLAAKRRTCLRRHTQVKHGTTILLSLPGSESAMAGDAMANKRTIVERVEACGESRTGERRACRSEDLPANDFTC